MKLKDIENPIYDQIASLRSHQLETIKDLYRKGQLALVLGSGINVPLGLPDWNRLLSMCFGIILSTGTFSDERYSQIFQELYGADETSGHRAEIKSCISALMGNGSPTINAPVGHIALEAGQYFFNAMNQYGSPVNSNDSALLKSLYKQLVGSCLHPNYSLESTDSDGNFRSAILRSCMEMICSGNVTEVITYNYDTLLESCLEMINHWKEGVQYRIHVDPSQLAKSGEMPSIYHVHGCIPIEVKLNDTSSPATFGKPSDQIVLSEEDYYEIERYPYDWRNVVQARMLLEKNCLFLGFSGDDYNFRRLLKLQPKEPRNNNLQHFQMISLDGVWQNLCTEANRVDSDPDRQLVIKQVMLNNYLDMRQRYLADYGISPVWTTHEQLSLDLEYVTTL